MASIPPLITAERFLAQMMGGNIQAGIEQFKKLWCSSKSLQLVITQQIKSGCLELVDEKSATQPDSNSKFRVSLSGTHNESTKSLIESGLISPPKIQEHIRQLHGGLSRKELLVLIEKHKAGRRSLGTYMLVRAWKKNCTKSPDFRLELITLEYINRAINENRADFFDEIADTVRFLKEEEYKENDEWNHDPGHWWQFHLLLYVLEHPKEKYAMREFLKYFQEEVGTNEMPTTKTLRSFCRSNGIALDSRPGAPKKQK